MWDVPPDDSLEQREEIHVKVYYTQIDDLMHGLT